MLNLEIKKGNGIDSLVSGYKAQKAEEVKRPDTEKHLFQTLLEKYDSVTLSPELHNTVRKAFMTPYAEVVDEVLTPEELDLFFKVLVTQDRDQRDYTMGPFLSVLIQNSFDAGYNNFEFNVNNVEYLDYVACMLRGKEDRKVDVSFVLDNCILESVGDYLEHCNFHIKNRNGFVSAGNYSKHCSFDIGGDAGGVGIESQDCVVVVDGKVTNCGERARDSNFIVSGRTSHCGKDAYDSTFSVEESGWRMGLRANNCRFYVRKNADKGVGSFAKDCFFDIKGSAETEIGYKSVDSTFKIEEVLLCDWSSENKQAPGFGAQSDGCTFNIGSAKLRYDKMPISNPKNCEFYVIDEDSVDLITKSVQEGENVIINRWSDVDV